MYKLRGEQLTDDEECFINVIELALDYDMKVTKTDFNKYIRLIKKRERIYKNESKIYNNN